MARAWQRAVVSDAGSTVARMAEPVAAWWERRRFSRGVDVPYAVGSYRDEWASFPALVRQYHPELNGGIVLSQIPPAAEVLLQWQCEVGHLFVATPEEQRSRPGRERRRSTWCPECADEAKPRVVPFRIDGSIVGAGPPAWLAVRDAGTEPPPRASRARRLCDRTPTLPPGEAFASVCAPVPASAVEAELRMRLRDRLEFDERVTAVRLARPFFDHLEAWPDIPLSDLKVAIEWDSTGRHGLEHVGPRESADRRKDRALRSVGWEVIRVRTGRLPAIGPHDILVSGLTKGLAGRVLDELRVIRGALIVDAWSRR